MPEQESGAAPEQEPGAPPEQEQGDTARLDLLLGRSYNTLRKFAANVHKKGKKMVPVKKRVTKKKGLFNYVTLAFVIFTSLVVGYLFIMALVAASDTEAPRIIGAKDQTVYIGEPVSLKKGVSVVDNKDEQVELMIDTTAVNLAISGSYKVKYSATDKAGNRNEVTVTITSAKRPEGYLTENELFVLVDSVLADILKPEMTDLDKLSTIFYWIADHINYTGKSDKSDWVNGAYLGISRGSGDCFNYFATAKALLTRAGFECIAVERVKAAKTRHYWNLVKYNGEYYHFDPMPNLAKYHYVCLLRTDAEIAEYTADGHPMFYTYVRNGIPASATIPLEIERKTIYG